MCPHLGRSHGYPNDPKAASLIDLVLATTSVNFDMVIGRQLGSHQCEGRHRQKLVTLGKEFKPILF